MRKPLIGAVATTATLALAAGAVAQGDSVVATTKVTPTKAGTPEKPKNATLTFGAKVDEPKQTVGQVKLKWSSGIKLSGKGLGRCDKGDLIASGPRACKDAKASPKTGVANAVVGEARAPLDFVVYPFVKDSKTLLFYLDQKGGGVQTALEGKIRNRELTITIPNELRQPARIDASLTNLSQTFHAKKGKNYLVSTTACKDKKHTLTVTLVYSDRVDKGKPGSEPRKPNSVTTNEVRCS